jgi:alpha-N-arabinofuranosidase
VQKLFSTQIGTTILPVQLGDDAKKLFGCATRDDQSGDVILKLVNMQSTAVPVDVSLAGLASTGGISGEQQVLSCDDLKAENSLDQPTKISPVQTAMNNLGAQFTQQLAPYSLTVMRIHAGAH